MSANIWFEEVDTALIEEIKKSVLVTDKMGHETPICSKAVVVRKPEEDFKVETFPCVSIYCTNYDMNKERYNPNPKVVGTNKEHHFIRLQKSPIPFNFNYQIDFWAKSQHDMNLMTKSWLKNHFRQFDLEVNNDGGFESHCNVVRLPQPISKSDLMSGGERLFHTFFSYVIWVELDNETRYNVNMVTEVNIDDIPM